MLQRVGNHVARKKNPVVSVQLPANVYDTQTETFAHEGRPLSRPRLQRFAGLVEPGCRGCDPRALSSPLLHSPPSCPSRTLPCNRDGVSIVRPLPRLPDPLHCNTRSAREVPPTRGRRSPHQSPYQRPEDAQAGSREERATACRDAGDAACPAQAQLLCPPVLPQPVRCAPPHIHAPPSGAPSAPRGPLVARPARASRRWACPTLSHRSAASHRQPLGSGGGRRHPCAGVARLCESPGTVVGGDRVFQKAL
eukprot:scaffold2339_cov368-Prasinococcus_capsulatus_cf.AAC.5